MLQAKQRQWWQSKLPKGERWGVLATVLSTNLTRDTLPPPLANLSIHWRFAKFLLLTYFAMFCSRSFAKGQGFGHDPTITLDTFMEFTFLPSLCDTLLFFICGRLIWRRGVDCLNFQIPVFCGAVLWELFGRVPASWGLGNNLASTEQWTAGTWIAFPLFIVLITGQLILHVYFWHKDKLLLGRVLEMAVIVGFGIGPFVTTPAFHLHHWYWAWLGGLLFNLRYSWSFAAQGFMWGMYVNGIAIWGRDSITGCDEVEYLVNTNYCVPS